MADGDMRPQGVEKRATHETTDATQSAAITALTLTIPNLSMVYVTVEGWAIRTGAGSVSPEHFLVHALARRYDADDIQAGLAILSCNISSLCPLPYADMLSGNDSIANNTPTTVALDIKNIESGRILVDTAQNRITAKVPGRYWVTQTAHWDGAAAGQRLTEFMKNGTVQVQPKLEHQAQFKGTASTVIDLAMNDFVQLKATQVTGGAINLQAQLQMFLMLDARATTQSVPIEVLASSNDLQVKVTGPGSTTVRWELRARYEIIEETVDLSGAG